MVEERVKLCNEQVFQCSICCNDIGDKANVYEIESCNCQFCKEVWESSLEIFISKILFDFSVYASIVLVK